LAPANPKFGTLSYAYVGASKMTHTDIYTLLGQVFDLLAREEVSEKFDFEKALLSLGASPAEAERLVDYIPSACGRAFCRELGMVLSDTYQRADHDGNWGPPQKFSDDPLWRSVEIYVEWLRVHSRKHFTLAAHHSAELNSVDNAVTAGETLASLRGAHTATVFNGPLKYS
jgi:hypothetical protein